jgi:hypothetical protein
MSTLDNLKCPNCGHIIPLTDLLSHQIAERTREEMRAEVLTQQEDITAREQRLKKSELVAERTIADRVAVATRQATATAEEAARSAVSAEVESLRQQAASADKQRREAQASELALRNRARELEEREQSLELEVARKLDTARADLTSEITDRLDNERRLKDAEKDKRLSDALTTVETLQRRLEQGSQQTQGEVLELEIEKTLAATFPLDRIEPVPKGVTGADVLHCVLDRSGAQAGSIIWEIKRTKAWKDEWLPKLKSDQRTAKADIAIIVSTTMPDAVKTFAHVEGVWIVSLDHAMALAAACRLQLMEVAQVRASSVGKKEKMEVIYDYLSGPGFRQRVEAIVEAFTEMQVDIAEERRVAERRWSKREKQVMQVISSTSGMYGDLQGLIGASLPDIKLLSAPEAE